MHQAQKSRNSNIRLPTSKLSTMQNTHHTLKLYEQVWFLLMFLSHNHCYKNSQDFSLHKFNWNILTQVYDSSKSQVQRISMRMRIETDRKLTPSNDSMTCNKCSQPNTFAKTINELDKTVEKSRCESSKISHTNRNYLYTQVRQYYI